MLDNMLSGMHKVVLTVEQKLWEGDISDGLGTLNQAASEIHYLIPNYLNVNANLLSWAHRMLEVFDDMWRWASLESTEAAFRGALERQTQLSLKMRLNEACEVKKKYFLFLLCRINLIILNLSILIIPFFFGGVL